MSVNHNSNYNMDLERNLVFHISNTRIHKYKAILLPCFYSLCDRKPYNELNSFFIHQNLLFFSGQLKNKRIVFLSCTLGLRYDKLLGEYVTSKSSDSPSLPQKNVKQLLAIWDYTKFGRFFLNFGKNIVRNIDMLIAHAFCLHCQQKPFLHSRKRRKSRKKTTTTL